METPTGFDSPQQHIAALEARVALLEARLSQIAKFWKDGEVFLRCHHLEVKAPNGEPRIELVAENNDARVSVRGKYKTQCELRATISPETDQLEYGEGQEPVADWCFTVMTAAWPREWVSTTDTALLRRFRPMVCRGPFSNPPQRAQWCRLSAPKGG